MPCGATRGKHQRWSGGRSKSERRAWVTELTVVSAGKARQGWVSRLGLASLDNPGWALEQQRCP